MATYNYNGTGTTTNYGDYNPSVGKLQTYLNSKGANLAVDNKYGALTQAAFAKYGAGYGGNSNVINSQNLTPVTPIPLASNETPPISTAGVNADLQAGQDAAQAKVDALNMQGETQSNDLSSMIASLGGKAADTAKTYKDTGVADLFNQVSDLNAQAKALNLEAQAIPIQTQQRNANTGATDAGVAPQTAGALRENALKALSLGQQYAIASGNYDKAKNYADQIIGAKYDQIEADIKAKQANLDALDKYQLTPAEKKLAVAQKALLDKQAQDVADKKATEQNNNSLSQGWAKTAFESNQPQLASQISALDPTSPSFKQDLAILQAKINPNGSLDSQYKQMQIKELAMKISDAKSASALSGVMSPVTQAQDGTYDTATQEALLSKLSPADAAVVREVGNYKMDIAKITSLAGGAREALAAKVALVYPGFNMANYAANAKYIKDLASTAPSSSGAIINSANKVINHLTEFTKDVTDLNSRFAFTGISSKINAVRNATTQPFSGAIQSDLASANTSAIGVTDELAKFFKGTGVSDVKTIEDWKKRIDPNATPAQLKGTVQSAINLLQGQLVPMIDQYKQTLGTNPPDGLFLKTDTIAKLSSLKNQGYEINIPGVNYTDKTAWQKYGGGTQSQWNNAIDTLQSAGYPITDENILQVVQLQ